MSVIIQAMFHILIGCGTIIPSGDVDGRPIYDVYDMNCNLVAEYAYKGEVMEYLNTGTFKHNELLEDCCPLIDK
jgi:hypothetical protein